MSQFNVGDAFSKNASVNYDEKNKKLAPIADGMHFLIRLALRDIPKKSKVLCVGVGTGAEILSLAQAFPEWTFTGVDPSAGMLSVCEERLKAAGLSDRCQLINGYINDVDRTPNFDAVLSVLVGHFVKREHRLDYYTAMVNRLRPNGYLINTEISYDLNSEKFPLMLKGWEGVQSLMGATAESLAALPAVLRDTLTVIPPEEVERLLIQSGVAQPVSFFQAMMIVGWYGVKKEK